MRILVDAHGLNSPTQTGKHYYTASLLSALDSQHRLIQFHSPLTGPLYYLHLWLHLFFRRYDLLLLPLSYIPILLTSRPTITVIYDVAFQHIAEFRPEPKATFIEKLFLPLVLRRSRGLIFLNRHLPAELNCPLPPYAILPGLSRLSSSKTSSSPLPAPYLLFVGTLEPRKNLPNLLRAYRQFLDQLPASTVPPKLVIAGKKGWYYQAIFKTVRDLHLTRNVVFTGYLPNPQLIRYYRHAQFFLYLPFYEGFGLPILEAMSFNLPVITSHQPVLIDTLGPGGLTADPHRPSQIAQAMLKLYLSPSLQHQLRRRLPGWLGQFTPDLVTDRFDTLLKTVLPGPRPQTHLPAVPPPNS